MAAGTKEYFGAKEQVTLFRSFIMDFGRGRKLGLRFDLKVCEKGKEEVNVKV